MVTQNLEYQISDCTGYEVDKDEEIYNYLIKSIVCHSNVLTI